MEADPEMETKYRREYLQFKHDEEFFRKRIENIHARYENVMYDIRRYGKLREGEEILGEDIYSTDYTDEEMYSPKLTRWFRTSKDLKLMQETLMVKAKNEEERAEVLRTMRRFKEGLEQKKKLNRNLEDIRAELVNDHLMKNLSPEKMLEAGDRLYGTPTEIPQDRFPKKDANPIDNYINAISAHDVYEAADKPYNETTQVAKEFADEIKNKYFQAKWKWFVNTYIKSTKVRNIEVEEMIENQMEEEGFIKDKLEYMYNHLDDHNDRQKVRQILSHEIHKKTTIQEIGEILDDIIVKYGSTVGDADLEVEGLDRDYESPDLYHSVKKIKQMGKIVPSLYEDRDALVGVKGITEQEVYTDIMHKVDQEDQERDHSKESLTDHEKLEIQIYSSLKKDPYYKHYIYNCLRYEAEYMNAKLNDVALSIAADNYKMRIKFDPINVPKLEKQQQVSDFVGRLQNDKAWGAGRRKSSRAIAAVKPGSGVITVNGKKFNDYFLLPFQRMTVVRPIRIANYTSVLDVDIWVRGGGFRGQAEACVPAISKAIARFDPGLREFLEKERLVYSDGRVRERQKYGKKRARKGRVYKRR